MGEDQPERHLRQQVHRSPTLPTGAVTSGTCEFAEPDSTCTASCGAEFAAAGAVTTTTYQCGSTTSGQWTATSAMVSCRPKCAAVPSVTLLHPNHVRVAGGGDGSCSSRNPGDSCAVQCASGFANDE